MVIRLHHKLLSAIRRNVIFSEERPFIKSLKNKPL